MPDALVRVRDVSKHYNALRPLRLQQMDLHEGQSIALMGLDKTAAEILVSVITGAALPDAGTVDVVGVPTSSIQTSSEWMKFLEQFGLLSERSVIVDQLTVEQNLALPFTMDVEELAGDVRNRVRHLAEEVGLSHGDLPVSAAQLPEPTRLRVRLGRALALNPRILLAEHPNAMLSADDTPAFAADLSRIISARRLSAVVITADRTFAAAVATDVLTLQPGSGALKRSDGWRRWFS
jgi:simple sugar transport system ATP-binding protein